MCHYNTPIFGFFPPLPSSSLGTSPKGEAPPRESGRVSSQIIQKGVYHEVIWFTRLFKEIFIYGILCLKFL
jgi:hypothetical protein